jgi:8-oxo-dGTP pyrophosphatase MutT (NUDIX family)
MNIHTEDDQRLNRVREVFGLTDAALTAPGEFRGYVTTEAVLANDHDQVLLFHHGALDEWLYFGGHLEGDDSSLAEAALWEICEETGIAAEPVIIVYESPRTTDVHIIPESLAKAESEHTHFDFRSILMGARWCPAEGVADKRLSSRNEATLDRSKNSPLR